MHTWILLLSFLFSSFFSFTTAEEASSVTGSLIVVYRADPEGHHLDRIRFWLKDAHQNLKMYPNGNAFVEDQQNGSRTVVIEDLPPGEYKLIFLIPNKDAQYEDPSEKTILVRPGEVAKFDQNFKLLEVDYHDSEKMHEWMSWLGFISPAAPDEIAQFFYRPRFRPRGFLGGSLNVETNNPDAEWVLLRGNQVIYHGSGSIDNLIVPVSSDYLIQAKPEEGYGVAVYPPGRFSIGIRQSFVARISYIKVQAPASEPEVEAPQTQQHELFLTVESNTDDAIYLLQHDEMKWQGHGKRFTFDHIPPGSYTLSFSSDSPEYLIPPKRRIINLEDYPEDIKVFYKITGDLVIETTAKEASVTIISESNPGPTINEQITGGKKVFRLLPGEYQVIVEENQQQKNQEVSVKGFETQVLKMDFKELSEQQLEQAHVVVISNIPEAKFRILKKDEKQAEPIGVYQGKYISLTLDPKITYEMIFDPVNNYTSPEPITFELKPREHRIIRADYVPSQKLAVVPEGIVLLGDVFNEGNEDERPVQKALINQFWIGVYDVTNALYATWLTKGVKEGKLIYLSDFDKKGQVIDLEGHLICKTIDSDPNSQITVSKDSLLGTVFYSIPGKDNFPVINVSWYGARAYCSGNNCRLPTEAEWEKAAAMSLENSGKSLKKFRYGFSQDSIDKTWANYKWDNTPITTFQVLTTEVGFYNGVNLLPLTSNDKNQLRTHDAKSPVGAYDMSGNVFQWVSDWYGARQAVKNEIKNPKGPSSGTQKIAKGGCYASMSEELRVSKRLPLDPEHCDPYTGFRVAK